MKVTAQLCYVGHVVRRPKGELIRDILLPTNGDQLKPWTTMIKTALKALSGPRFFGCARWRKDWVKVSSEVAQDFLNFVEVIETVAL